MMELDTFKRLWQEPSELQQVHPISREELVSLVRARSADIKRETVQRVRAETLTYVVLVVVPVVMMLAGQGLTTWTVVASLGVLALPGLIIGVLTYKAYQLRTLPLGGNLRESLTALVAAVDSTSRLYMAAYMICVTVGMAAVEGFLLGRFGVNWISVTGFVAGVAFLAWAFRSGRTYLQGMFGDYRAELTNCLGELGDAPLAP